MQMLFSVIQNQVFDNVKTNIEHQTWKQSTIIGNAITYSLMHYITQINIKIKFEYMEIKTMQLYVWIKEFSYLKQQR